ncbi:MAG: hypothetical protein ABI599_17710 [Flavobacteriales bacterium]
MRSALLIGACQLTGAFASAQAIHLPLHQGWTFSQSGKERWYTAEVPGTVQQDLLRNGLIPDPMRNSNIDSVQWVGNEDWIYRCVIDASDTLFEYQDIHLFFKGLDTFAEIYLNDSLLGTTNNMFRAWGWPVKGVLRPGANGLKVVFRSVVKEGAKLRDRYGIQLPHDNDPSGVSPYVRKAGFQFGWDFAPRLLTCGIWQPVELRVVSDPTEREIARSNRGDLRLVREPDGIGTSFRFEMDGKPVFMKGCNVVPPASMLSAGNDPQWIRLVKEMQLAHMNMARVWAGGVYPPEVFFNACDTAGIWVWQDFMFANMVPGDDRFVANALSEAEEKVSAFQQYRSVALWCGNNELDVAWKNWGWQATYKLDEDAQRAIAQANDEFFVQNLAAVANGSGRDYTPTSPLSNWGNASGLKSGDLHYWGVWHGDSALSSFKNNVGRFVSEYGFQSYPDSVTLAHYIDPEFLYLGSPVLAERQKSYKTDKPIWTAIERELGERPTTLGRFIDCSQVVQADAYRQAIWAHRTQQPHCMGTLFWQLNDVWAAPSWSTIDVDFRWKAAQYEVKRSYADRVLTFEATTAGGVALDLWSDTELDGDTVLLEFWSVQGELLRTQVEHPKGTGLLRLVEWPKDQWPAGIVVYAFGAGAAPRMFSGAGRTSSGSSTQGPTLTEVAGISDLWEIRTAVPVSSVKIDAGSDAQPSDNWFPVVPGHPVRVLVRRGPRATGQRPQASTFRR